jgi:hypothetical protein
MQQKSNLFQCLQKVFLEHVDYYNHVCKLIRADYDSMYRDSFIRNWLLNKTVKVQFSAPYHHQGNGIAEYLCTNTCAKTIGFRQNTYDRGKGTLGSNGHVY